jgi:hypothetical protein
MMSLDAEGKPTPDTPWLTTKGRKPIATFEEVQIMADELKSKAGRGWSSGEISNMLVEIQSKKTNNDGRDLCGFE